MILAGYKKGVKQLLTLGMKNRAEYTTKFV
jgi:hypothetical protein